MEFIKKDKIVLIEAPCKYCGSVYAQMFEGKGPHIAELRCRECKQHNQWMSKANYEVYLCYMQESPIDSLMEKISLADEAYKEADIKCDWIERKTAQKYYNGLIEALKKMPGHEHFEGYGT